jgi:hypothetical protein
MSEDICDGVKILVERMKTNPEEFMEDFGKWDGLIKTPWDENVTDWGAALNPTEIAMLKEARRKILREKFTAQVMKTLLTVDDAPKQPSVTTNPFRHSPNELARFGHPVYGNSIVVGGTGGAGTWVTTGTNTPVETSMMERFEKVWKEYKKGNKK